MESARSELPSAERRPDGLYSISFIDPAAAGGVVVVGGEQPQLSPVSLLRLSLLSELRPPSQPPRTLPAPAHRPSIGAQLDERLHLNANSRSVHRPDYASIARQTQLLQAGASLQPLPPLRPLPPVPRLNQLPPPPFGAGALLPLPPPSPPSSQADSTGDGPAAHEHDDSTRSAVKELMLPVLLSGFGNMGAGIILDSAQNWPVFKNIPQLIVLVPALLGLKGNVEMTLSSRLATHANLGQLSDPHSRKQIVLGNISLAQCQASAIGLLAPLIAIAFTFLHGGSAVTSASNQTELAGGSSLAEQASANEHQLQVLKVLLVMASSVLTSGLADLMLSSLMCFIVIQSVNRFKVNADNIATPIAASVGDLATMSLLAITSRTLYTLADRLPWLPVVPIAVWMVVILVSGRLASQNRFTSKLVYTGWTPLLAAMLLQNSSGSVMERFFRVYPRMAAFQPVINGFGGNLVAVQSSRIATYLHRTCKKRQLPTAEPNWLVMPWTVFFGQNKHGRLALILILIAAPMQLPFVFMLRYVTGNAVITPAFLLTYYVCCTLQVTLMLYLGYVFVHLLWRLGFNPDNNSIPILTALADLLGSLLFAGGFLFLNTIHDANTAPIAVLQPMASPAAASAAGGFLGAKLLSALGESLNATASASNRSQIFS